MKYRRGAVSVEESVTRANGRSFRLVKVRIPEVAVMLALVDGKIVMERQHRPVIGKTLLELPAGKADGGEKPSRTAVRELEEETGYRASRARPAFSAYMDPGIMTEKHHYFIMTGLRKTRPHRDRDEEIRVELVSPKRALSMIRSDDMEDGKSIAFILWASSRGVI